MTLLFALACSDAPPTDTGTAACDSGADVTWSNWADGFFATYCRSCHSIATPDRRGAPEGVDFDSPADARTWSERVRARVLVDETMPIGGGVYPEDLELLARYLDCADG